jgi:hypothetical protein
MDHTHPAVVYAVLSKLSRAELMGVNPHTLPIALHRAENERLDFSHMTERQIAAALLERVRYPQSMQELYLFLNHSSALNSSVLTQDEIAGELAPQYIVWLAGLLNDPEPNVQKNARILARWLAANRAASIEVKQDSLDMMRRVADDPASSRKNAAVVAYVLGMCGVIDDYDRVVRLAEIVIADERESIPLVADALYRLYPPALINALQFFIENTPPNSKQFSAGIELLAKVAEIEDQAFWNTYYNEMDRIVEKVQQVAGRNSSVERILDLIEKHLAFASDE